MARPWRNTTGDPQRVWEFRLGVSVQIDANNNIVSVHRGHGAPPIGYTPLKRAACCDRVLKEPRRYRVRVDEEGDLITEPKRWVRFSADPVFLADGTDYALVAVGPIDPSDGPTAIRLNGVDLSVPPGEVVVVGPSAVAGVWVVELTDHRYYARQMRLTIRGVEATPETVAALSDEYRNPGGALSKASPRTDVSIGNRGVQAARVTVGRHT